MRSITVCGVCGSGDCRYVGRGFEKVFCNDCLKETPAKEKLVESPYERTRREVYATGNKWAIENFNATH